MAIKRIFSTRNISLLLFIFVALFLGSLNWVQPLRRMEGMDNNYDENEEDEEEQRYDQGPQ